MTASREQDELLRTKINGETARFAWKELQRFFAAGTVIAVEESLDLVDVAMQIAKDNKAAIEQWMKEGKVGPISDSQAQRWLESDAAVWTVVVKPFILVQQRHQ